MDLGPHGTTTMPLPACLWEGLLSLPRRQFHCKWDSPLKFLCMPRDAVQKNFRPVQDRHTAAFCCTTAVEGFCCLDLHRLRTRLPRRIPPALLFRYHLSTIAQDTCCCLLPPLPPAPACTWHLFYHHCCCTPGLCLAWGGHTCFTGLRFVPPASGGSAIPPAPPLTCLWEGYRPACLTRYSAACIPCTTTCCTACRLQVPPATGGSHFSAAGGLPLPVPGLPALHTGFWEDWEGGHTGSALSSPAMPATGATCCCLDFLTRARYLPPASGGLYHLPCLGHLPLLPAHTALPPLGQDSLHFDCLTWTCRNGPPPACLLQAAILTCHANCLPGGSWKGLPPAYRDYLLPAVHRRGPACLDPAPAAFHLGGLACGTSGFWTHLPGWGCHTSLCLHGTLHSFRLGPLPFCCGIYLPPLLWVLSCLCLPICLPGVLGHHYTCLEDAPADAACHPGLPASCTVFSGGSAAPASCLPASWRGLYKQYATAACCCSHRRLPCIKVLRAYRRLTGGLRVLPCCCTARLLPAPVPAANNNLDTYRWECHPPGT